MGFVKTLNSRPDPKFYQVEKFILHVDNLSSMADNISDNADYKDKFVEGILGQAFRRRGVAANVGYCYEVGELAVICGCSQNIPKCRLHNGRQRPNGGDI